MTDLTYENIRHISASKLLEVIDRNFGGGWDSLSQSIKDIIESGFDISTTTLPKDRLHKAGGLYEKKVNDGFEVLEIAKGLWVEAIFAKTKPIVERPKLRFDEEPGEEKEYDEEEFENYFEKVRQAAKGHNYQFEYPKSRKIIAKGAKPLGWVKLTFN